MFTVITNNIERLRIFSQLEHPSTFRYFKNRNFEDAIKSHVYTVLYSIDEQDIGYGHIDKEGDIHYIGLCVMPPYQGQGIGKKILEKLIKESTTDLYLTVDDDNIRAINLYRKFGFVKVEGRLYMRKHPLMLEVSIGEGLDKLTILDIKLDKIKNEEKRAACQKEFDAIYPILKPSLDKCKFLYDCLKYINLQIWNLQDDVRDNKKEIPNLLDIILDLNDMRFRLKKRINQRASSSLHEQKGYSEKVGIFVGHMGMGDLINLNGAIRYASVQVDHLFVVCRKMFIDNMKAMIGDDPYIEIIPCENHVNDVFDIQKRRDINGRKITNWFISGNWLSWNRERTYENLPDSFYKDLKFPIEVKRLFFHYDKPTDELPVPSIPYIFAHVTASTGSKINFENSRNLLVIDPNTNHYPEGHQFHNLAKHYVDKPMFTYGRVIENADEIHVTDSAFYCLACYLPLKASVKKCYNREDGSINEKYTFL